jgi:hypothetical protein
MRTLAELRSFARYMLDEKVETFWDDIELDKYLNIEYNNLVHEIQATYAEYYEEEVALATAANSRYIDLPDNHSGKIVAVTRDGVPLAYKNKKEMIRDSSGEVNGSGAPIRFTVSGNRLMVDPIPDGIYDLVLTQNYLPVDMVADADEPDFPNGYESLIPFGTVIFALLKDKQEMNRIYSLYDKRKNNMMVSLQSRQTWEPRRVRRY